METSSIDDVDATSGVVGVLVVVDDDEVDDDDDGDDAEVDDLVVVSVKIDVDDVEPRDDSILHA